ncbi:acyltransferase [Micropruina glycogenica]
MGRLRESFKRLAPPQAVSSVRWGREVWADLRLRLLSEAGFIPSHTVRNCLYRSAGMRLHPTSSIHWRAEFYAPERIEIGPYCTIGDSAFLDGRSGLTIGACVNLGSHVSIYTRQHDIDDPDFTETGAPVRIEDHAWVSSHSILLPGVTIGEGAVVAAGGVVAKSVPAYTLVGGNPARHIRDRSRDLRYRLGYAKRFV